MASHEIEAQQGRNTTTSGVDAEGKTPLSEPTQTQTPQKANATKFEANSKDTATEDVETNFRELEEKNRRFEKATTTKVQARETAEESRLANAGPHKSQHAFSKPQTTTTSAKSLDSNARTLDNKQAKPASAKFWDGFITDKPPFPLTELIALKPSSSFANFYAFARRNGRTGMIKTDLIQDILKNSARVPLDDVAMMSVVQPQPKIYKHDAAIERKEPKDKRNIQGPTDTADSALNTEDEITRQTFEQVCDELKIYIEDMETGSTVESKAQQTRLCIEALTTVSEKAKYLGKDAQTQRHNNTAAAAASSPSSTPPSTDLKFTKRVPKKNPNFPMLEVESITDLKFGDFEVEQEVIAPKDKGLKELWQGWKEGAADCADDDGQAFMSYSEASKAAARYYALTSAYGNSF